MRPVFFRSWWNFGQGELASGELPARQESLVVSPRFAKPGVALDVRATYRIPSGAPGMIRGRTSGMAREGAPAMVREGVLGVIRGRASGVMREGVPWTVREGVLGMIRGGVQGMIRGESPGMTGWAEGRHGPSSSECER